MLFSNQIDLLKNRDRVQRTNGYQDNYIAHRAKIGVILPSTNTAVEYDCQKIIPRGVSWHFSRFMISQADLSDDKKFMDFLEMVRQNIGASIDSVMSCKPDHVMMGMSAETFWGGIKGNDGFVEKVQQMIGIDTGLTTGANAVTAALSALGIKGNCGQKIAVITPYQPIGDKNVRLFFEDSGYEVVSVEGLKCENAHDAIALVPEHKVMELVMKVNNDSVNAIVQVGTNLCASNVFPTLEKLLHKPIVPINIATIWHALRSCGINDQYDNKGRLLENH